MPASLGSTSANICSPAPERANGFGLEGATQPRLKGLVFVFTSDREGHVRSEHDRAGQGRYYIFVSLASTKGSVALGCATCQKTAGFSLPLNTITYIPILKFIINNNKQTPLSRGLSKNGPVWTAGVSSSFVNTNRITPLSGDPPKNGLLGTNDRQIKSIAQYPISSISLYLSLIHI